MAPATAGRSARPGASGRPPARSPAEAPPLRLPLSAVHGADEAGATGKRRAGRQQHAPQPKAKRTRPWQGREIGD